MPISDLTKQVVSSYKSQLLIRWTTLSKERDEHLAIAQGLQAQMSILKSQADALTADIPEPQPAQAPP